MNFLVNLVETELGLDLDGDGKIGGRPMRRPPHVAPPAALAQPVHHGHHHDHYAHHQQQVPVVGSQPSAPAGQRHRALFIGINYQGTQSELRGCINDVRTMQRLLDRLGFPLNDVRVLTEDHSVPGYTGLPTKRNILDSLQWLADGAHPGDTLFLHYSGHGTSVPDTSGDEDDGMDEAMVPLDYQQSGVIIDDIIHDILVKSLPLGVRLTAVMDCCHSGTILDLPCSFVATQENMAAGRAVSKRRALRRFAQHKAETSPAVVAFSGCKDNQTSADVSNVSSFEVPQDPNHPGGAGGACTNALAEILYLKQSLKFSELLRLMQTHLAQRGFEQVPQMTSTEPIDLSEEFSLWGPIRGGSW